jgi:hypothetical protein
MKIVNFYDNIDLLINQNTNGVNEVSTSLKIFFSSSWCIIILITILYDLFKV